MAGSEIDKYPVAQLDDRYNLARSAVYTRMKQLSIRPERVGNKSYINREQLELMDSLHRFINETGGSAAEFIEARGLNQSSAKGRNGDGSNGNGKNAGSGLALPGDFGRFMSAMADFMSRSQPAPDPIKPYSDLESAARNGWQLSTEHIAYLLNVSPAEVERCPDQFQDAGFIFTRVGYRRDGQAAWQVTKPRRRI
ncbi:hypothetical protein C7271_01900 [filamentous cyanobacterium CCP5]|nr:hypothetical protein C7271_01900 [filamentous cyanobacterium CCP5]